MTNQLRDDSHVRPNEEEVASKVVDGEAILINLTNGLYYSMDGVSGYVWSLIMEGSSVDRMADVLAERYPVAADEARDDVRRIVHELLGEGLITVNGGSPSAEPAQPPSGPTDAYEAPTLTRYDDMAEMFALDPPLPELPPLSTDPS